MPRQSKVLFAALGFFVLWTLATWVFEGRIRTLLRPEATLDRVVYAFAVNLALGLGGAAWLLRRWVRRGDLAREAAGLQPTRRTAWAVAAGLALGFAAYLLQGAPSLDPVVVGNAFAQVFVVSAAEVVVCWAVVGAVVRARIRQPRWLALGVAATAASVLFGVYHFAHSPPFDTWAMVALLSAVGLGTSAFFFVSRDVAGTVVFHNFLGTFGVVQALVAADALASLQRWQPALLFTAGLTALVLAIAYRAVGRASPGRPAPSLGNEFPA